jgi:prolyl oligopeptidase
MINRMRIVAGIVGALLVMSSGNVPGADDPKGTATPRAYPPAPEADVVDDYHGTEVADPFRPLEDPDSAETRAWIEAENKITFGFLRASPRGSRSSGG